MTLLSYLYFWLPYRTKWKQNLHDCLNAEMFLLLNNISILWKDFLLWKNRKVLKQIDIEGCYIVRCIFAWGVVYCFIFVIILFCSTIPLVVIDVVTIWGSALRFVKMTNYFVWLTLTSVNLFHLHSICA